MASSRNSKTLSQTAFFNGANNASRLNNAYSGSGNIDTGFDSRSYAGMNGAGGNMADAFSPVSATVNNSQNSYPTYAASQPGAGFF